MVITPLLNPHEASTRGGSFIFPGQAVVLRRIAVTLSASTVILQVVAGSLAPLIARALRDLGPFLGHFRGPYCSQRLRTDR